MESTPEQMAEGGAIIKVLSDVLERLVMSNVGLALQDPGQITKFHALKAPGIGIFPYLERIHKYASCSNECFILALIYIDRLIQRNNFLLTELNVHRVVITAILLAAKFFDDAYYNNAYYSKVGGVLVSEMNGLEVDFLFRINFSLFVTPDQFGKYKAELVAHSYGSAQILPQQIQPIDIASQQLAHIQQLAPVAQTQHQQVQLITSASHSTAESMQTGTGMTQQCDMQQQHAIYSTEQQLVNNPLAQQQILQRANSLPPMSNQPSGCVYNNPPYSAPVMSMLPVSEDPYMLVNNQLLPLQTTMVHHHHGVQDQVNFHPQAAGGAIHSISNNSFGSLVAGHY